MGAWPWPRDRAWKRWAMPVCSASCSRALVGSTPGDRMKISGVRGVESSNTCQKHRAPSQAEAPAHGREGEMVEKCEVEGQKAPGPCGRGNQATDQLHV